ncbi:hypothetical protein BCR34DRAFT_166180 [Clohesyomyces aquaticus]|uniref:Rhodopsin domain-containing protein n=1 Tax=Clohesyomyces aquaticus TaxID=1231657 RepID=A0A1Y1YHE7_9PLEO|nr:hypothetical protein BCR34DRAFT_166180 [Clohesyomyces aquaticus]
MTMDRHTPPVDDNLGPGALAICTPILAIALILYVTRVVSRTTPTNRLDFADYMVSLAVPCEIITYAFFIAMMVFGFGRQTYYLPVEDIKMIVWCTFPIALVGQMASALARISILALLVKFGMTRTWKISAWTAMALQAVVLFCSEILLLCSCRPIRALLENVPNARCLPSRVLWTTGYVYTVGINLLADFACAIAPLFVVINLSRSNVERSLMFFAMMLGTVATVATAIRIKHLRAFQQSSSATFRDTYPLYLLTRIEELVLLVAASAPFLKPAIERILRQWNMPTFQNKVIPLNSYHMTSGPGPEHSCYSEEPLKEQSTSSSSKAFAKANGNKMELEPAKSTSPDETR